MTLSNELHSFRTPGSAINIYSLSKFFEWRLTSKKHDSVLAAAVLLNLDIKELMDREEGQYMKHFLKMIRMLPKSIIFKDIPRLEIDNFHWAPATFPVGSRYVGRSMEPGTVTCTETGLLGEYPVFHFNPGEDALFQPNARNHFIIYDDDCTPPTRYHVQGPHPPRDISCDHLLFSANTIRRSGAGDICYVVAVLQTAIQSGTEGFGEDPC
jgi:hypothetical protein